MSNLLCFDGPFPRESISEKQLEAIQHQITAAHDLLMGRSGPGSKYLGWLELPETCQSELPGIIEAADIITEQSEVLVVVGVGGSYLGSRAAIEGLAGSFHNYNKGAPKVFFAGNNLSSSYHAELIDTLKDKDFSVNVISKSGTTLEPAIAFRLLRDILEHRYGREEARR